MTYQETLRQQLRRNFVANNPPEFVAWYDELPEYVPGMVVICPRLNYDGTPIFEDDVPGCGSADTTWTGADYDCNHCGIFFSSYAAYQPRRRERDRDEYDFEIGLKELV